jgi:hypothetical protein
MHACPSCGQQSVSAWRKFRASSTFPLSCSSCGQFSFVSGWAHAVSALVLEVLLWGSIVFALVVASWLGLLLFPAGVAILSIVIGYSFPLKQTQPSAVLAARRAAGFQLVTAILVVVVAYWFWGVK